MEARLRGRASGSLARIDLDASAILGGVTAPVIRAGFVRARIGGFALFIDANLVGGAERTWIDIHRFRNALLHILVADLVFGAKLFTAQLDAFLVDASLVAAADRRAAKVGADLVDTFLI